MKFFGKELNKVFPAKNERFYFSAPFSVVERCYGVRSNVLWNVEKGV
jgi:hypothetical protein